MIKRNSAKEKRRNIKKLSKRIKFFRKNNAIKRHR